MKQIRIGRSAGIQPGHWYLGQEWLPDRVDCYQDYELPLETYRAEFGEQSHWLETREIDDSKLDPEYIKANQEIEARMYKTA